MSLEIIAAILLGGLFLLLLIGMEIFLAFGIMASIGILLFVAAEPQNQLAWTAWVTLNVFSFTAVPLFIFMGEMFSNTGVVRYLLTGLTSGWAVCPVDWDARLPVPVLSSGR